MVLFRRLVLQLHSSLWHIYGLRLRLAYVWSWTGAACPAILLLSRCAYVSSCTGGRAYDPGTYIAPLAHMGKYHHKLTASVYVCSLAAVGAI